jgi:hypothetical protein
MSLKPVTGPAGTALAGVAPARANAPATVMAQAKSSFFMLVLSCISLGKCWSCNAFVKIALLQRVRAANFGSFVPVDDETIQ